VLEEEQGTKPQDLEPNQLLELLLVMESKLDVLKMSLLFLLILPVKDAEKEEDFDYC